MREVNKSTWIARRLPADLEVSWRPMREGGGGRIGDVVLCEVTNPSLHTRVETETGARSRLYPGDRIACVLGNRYATSSLAGVGRVRGAAIDLLSASGVCGTVTERNQGTAHATSLDVLGLGFVGERPLNVWDYRIATPDYLDVVEPTWIVVVGSAMNSGKTTACSSLIRGFASSGCHVGALKLTGTASARDVGSYRDAGASCVFDFLDAGWPSTAGCCEDELNESTVLLMQGVRAHRPDVVVVEIADGLLQRETRMMMEIVPRLMPDGEFVFTASESMAAAAGVERLRGWGARVLAVSGIVSNSPLAVSEVRDATGAECVATSKLSAMAAGICEERHLVSAKVPVVACAAHLP